MKDEHPKDERPPHNLAQNTTDTLPVALQPTSRTLHQQKPHALIKHILPPTNNSGIILAEIVKIGDVVYPTSGTAPPASPSDTRFRFRTEKDAEAFIEEWQSMSRARKRASTGTP